MNLPLLAAALISAQPIANPDVLEPSVQNEVDHALSRVPTNALACASACGAVTNDWFGTNALTATDTAIRLISAQGRDGRWTIGTNDLTALAVDILKSVSGTEYAEPDAPPEPEAKADCGRCGCRRRAKCRR